LYAAVLEIENPRESSQESRFTQSWHAFEEYMASGDQANNYTLDNIVLPYDDAANFALNGSQPFRCFCNFVHCIVILLARKRGPGDLLSGQSREAVSKPE
jgi:hypothetical protein